MFFVLREVVGITVFLRDLDIWFLDKDVFDTSEDENMVFSPSIKHFINNSKTSENSHSRSCYRFTRPMSLFSTKFKSTVEQQIFQLSLHWFKKSWYKCQMRAGQLNCSSDKLILSRYECCYKSKESVENLRGKNWSHSLNEKSILKLMNRSCRIRGSRNYWEWARSSASCKLPYWKFRVFSVLRKYLWPFLQTETTGQRKVVNVP